jgi:hypothetical protein
MLLTVPSHTPLTSMFLDGGWCVETRHFIYFYIGQVAFLLFKSGWVCCWKNNFLRSRDGGVYLGRRRYKNKNYYSLPSTLHCFVRHLVLSSHPLDDIIHRFSTFRQPRSCLEAYYGEWMLNINSGV